MNIATQTAKKLAGLWGEFTSVSWFDEFLLGDEEAFPRTGLEVQRQKANHENSPAYGGL